MDSKVWFLATHTLNGTVYRSIPLIPDTWDTYVQIHFLLRRLITFGVRWDYIQERHVGVQTSWVLLASAHRQSGIYRIRLHLLRKVPTTKPWTSTLFNDFLNKYQARPNTTAGLLLVKSLNAPPASFLSPVIKWLYETAQLQLYQFFLNSASSVTTYSTFQLSFYAS